MSSHPDDQTLALFAGGDCGEAERRQVERHIASCELCLRAVEAFRLDGNLLAQSRHDPDPLDVAELRQRVLLQIPVKPRRVAGWILPTGWRWLAVPAAALLAATLFRVPVRQSSAPNVKEPELRSRIVSVARGLVIADVPLKVRAKTGRPKRSGLREVQLIAAANKPAVLKIKTQDPNVVILWQMETKEQVDE
jgi:anti-sigma factor RsiW